MNRRLWKAACRDCGGPIPCGCRFEQARIEDENEWDSQNSLAAGIIVLLLLVLLVLFALAPKYAPWLMEVAR